MKRCQHESNMGSRIIIHCDLDAFFAAVEILHHNLDPAIPLIIGSDPQALNTDEMTKASSKRLDSMIENKIWLKKN